MAPELTRLAAKLVEGKYHLLLHLYESSTPCVTVTTFLTFEFDHDHGPRPGPELDKNNEKYLMKIRKN